MIRVLLVDDQTLVRSGIRSLLGLSEGIDVVAEAQDGQDAMAQLTASKALDIDVVLMDIRMPQMDGITTLIAMHESQIAVPVLMLTTFDDHELVLQAVKAGAKGYLLKDVSLETLTDAITHVANGESFIQPAITERLLTSMASQPSEPEKSQIIEALSAKEQEILRLMAAGCSNREIAQSMHKSEGTIKNQVSSILNKLGVRDRTRAVLKGIELGLM